MTGDNTIYFVGTAGAGKSSLVGAYDEWARSHGLGTLVVNLDPGAESLPYEPDVDIREYVRLDEIMAEHGLGPNGAQIAAADMIALNLEEVQAQIQAARADQVIVDTPGQMELFVFRQAGKHIVETLNPQSSLVAYLLDPFLARTASGFASQLMLAATTMFRFHTPMAFLLSKSDLIDPESLETILSWGRDATALEHDVLSEEAGMDREFATQIARLLESMQVQNQLIPVSAHDATGLDDFYALVQSVVGAREDATPEYDTVLDHGEEEAK